jgi:hypothetical protein
MNNITVEKDSFQINYKFYYFLKILNSNDGLSEAQLRQTFKVISESKNKNAFLSIFKIKILGKIKSEQKSIILKELLLTIENNLDYDIFTFAVYILIFKPLLIEYSKVIELDNIMDDVFILSLERDNFTKNMPYAFRVQGALISLIFFDYINKKDKEHFPTSDYQDTFLNELFKKHANLKEQGLEANQMFMILLQESISQSIKSTAGADLEDLVITLLTNEGISDISKKIDAKNHEIEYDHFFLLNNKYYGVSTKRTLRERYKQFKKTKTAEADIFIHITSGLDLNETKATTITSDSFGCFIFVFPEIYNSSDFMIQNDRIFSTLDLNRETLIKLQNY